MCGKGCLLFTTLISHDLSNLYIYFLFLYRNSSQYQSMRTISAITTSPGPEPWIRRSLIGHSRSWRQRDLVEWLPFTPPIRTAVLKCRSLTIGHTKKKNDWIYVHVPSPCTCISIFLFMIYVWNITCVVQSAHDQDSGLIVYTPVTSRDLFNAFNI